MVWGIPEKMLDEHDQQIISIPGLSFDAGNEAVKPFKNESEVIDDITGLIKSSTPNVPSKMFCQYDGTYIGGDRSKMKIRVKDKLRLFFASSLNGLNKEE